MYNNTYNTKSYTHIHTYTQRYMPTDNIWFGTFCNVFFSPHNTCHRSLAVNLITRAFVFVIFIFFRVSIVSPPFLCACVRFYRRNRYTGCNIHTTYIFAHSEKLFRARNTYLMGLQDNRGFCEIKYLHCALYYTWQFSFVKINCYCKFRPGIYRCRRIQRRWDNF